MEKKHTSEETESPAAALSPDEQALEELTQKIKECLCLRAQLNVRRGCPADAFRDLNLAEKYPGPHYAEFQTRFSLVLQLQQVDEILQFQKSPDATPEMKREIDEFLKRFAKGNVFPHDHPEMAKHIDFIRWMKCNGSNLRKTKIVMYAKDFRGLHATVDIGKLQEILTVPINMAISGADLEETELGKKLHAAKTFSSRWEIYMFPLIYTLGELHNPNSKHKKWLDVLPSAASDHPAFFSPTELNWLKGSALVSQLEIDKKRIKLFYERIGKVDSGFCTRHTLHEFTLYYYLLCSRYFGIHSYDPNRAFMVPYADLANTGTLAQRNASWDYDCVRRQFRFFALKPIKADETIWLYYGHGSNFVYMLYYGITLDDSEHDAVTFILDFEKVPHGKLKAALVHQEVVMSKKAKFYACFGQRRCSNQSFMSNWRYYLYSDDPAKLATCVKPPAKSVDSFDEEKRKVAFPPSTVSYEKRVLTTILDRAKANVKEYPTKLEDDEAQLKQPGLEYKRICSLRLIIGEKRSLRLLVEMVECALELTGLGNREDARKQFAAVVSKPPYAPYIEEELLNMEWK